MPATTILSGALRETRGLVILAVPLVIGLSAATLIGVTDTLMLAPLGAVPLAAAAITSSVAMIFYAAIYGLLAAVGVAVARAHGARTGRTIPPVLRAGIGLGVLAGAGGAALMALGYLALPWLGQPPEVLAVLAPYWMAMALLLIPFAVLTAIKQAFEAIDRPWTGVGFAFLGTGLNVPLNWALIHGPGPFPALGLTGAGIASLLAETIACLAALAYVYVARSTRRLRTRQTAAPGAMDRLAREGAPLGLGYVGETGAMALAGLMMGWFGATALAANQVANSVGSLLYMVPLGMAGAVAIRVSQAAGAGEQDRLRPIALAAMGIVTAWMLVSAGVLMFAGGWIARTIVSDPAVAQLAAAIFVVFALMQVADGLQSTGLGALRGLSDTGWPSVVTLIAYWGLALPLGWALAFPLGMGPVGIWVGFGAGLMVAAVLLPWRFLVRTAGRSQA
jgi:multidrug resistance protein, MATE family